MEWSFWERVMDTARFRDLLDLRGADLSAWPEADRRAARELMARDESAQAAWDGASAVDALIGAATRIEPAPVGLATRIVASASDTGVTLPGWMSGLKLLLGGGMASIAASAIGFLAMNALLSASDGGYGDLLDLADGSYMTTLMVF